MLEIKRKFLATVLPNLSGVKVSSYRRSYIFVGQNIELRVQKIDKKYQIERLVSRDKGREIQTTEISAGEYEVLRKLGQPEIVRDCYFYSDNPMIEIMIYHGKFEGLVRIEVSFEGENEAKSFIPLEWFGREIANTSLWRDSELIKLDESQFKTILDSAGMTRKNDH